MNSLLDRREVEALLARHDAGREDLSDALFTLVMLACWHSVFIEGRLPSLQADL